MTRAAAKTTVAYYRTSSAPNVGADKDSLKRQGDAVRAYAPSTGSHSRYDDDEDEARAKGVVT
jgi:hypothetical protein